MQAFQHGLQHILPNSALPKLSKLRHNAALRIQNFKFNPSAQSASFLYRNFQPSASHHLYFCYSPASNKFCVCHLPPRPFNLLKASYPELYLKIQFVPHSKHTSLHYKPQRLMLCREIIAFCSEDRIKHIHPRCGQNVKPDCTYRNH